MGNLKKIKSYLILMLVVMFAFTPLNVFAEGVQGNNKLLEEINLIAEDKIEASVLEQFDENEMVEAIVLFNAKADVEKAAQDAVNEFKLGASTSTIKVAKGYGVYNALKDVAFRSQKNVKRYIDEEMIKGNIEKSQEYLIVNAIYIKAKRNVIEEIAKYPEVKAIKENKRITITDASTDNNSNEINPQEVDDGVLWNVNNVNAPKAWDLGAEGQGVVVGVIDSGFEIDHPAIQKNWRGYNPADPSNPNVEGNWIDVTAEKSNLPVDKDGHGTHVTGTILGYDEGQNLKIGVAPKATFIAARVFADGGATYDVLLEAGQWMLAPGGDPSKAPDVINNSWGGGPDEIDEFFMEVVDNWIAADILPVFAAGNDAESEYDPRTIASPGNYPQVLTVAAVNENNMITYFSGQGPTPYGDIIKPEVSAPGFKVYSSYPGKTYEYMNGTSMATPAVTGVAALVKSSNNDLTPQEIKTLLMDTATSLTDDNYRESPNMGYGYGIVNAFKAVSEVAKGITVIEGTVYSEGNDSEKPIIYHEQGPEHKYAYGLQEYKVYAEVSDEFAVKEVKIAIKNPVTGNWDEFDTRRVAGDGLYRKGLYEGYLRSEYVKNPEVQYKFIASDVSDNTVESEVYHTEVYFGIKPGEFATDFSEKPDIYMSGEFEWGTPTFMNGPLLPDGEKLIGTNLDGAASEWTESQVLLIVDMREAENASLLFRQWYKMYAGLGRILISNDYGETFEQYSDFEGRYLDSNGWQDGVISLKNYDHAERPLFIMFNLRTSMFNTDAGWYLDDFELVSDDNEAPIPPQDIEAETKADGIYVSWLQSPSRDEIAYNVYRSKTSGAGYQWVTTTQDCNFVDMAADRNETQYYVITAVDSAGNESEYSNEVKTHVKVLLFNNDFEDNDGGFVSGGPDKLWAWGEPGWRIDVKPYSGEKMWGTDLEYFAYPKDYCSLETPIFNLTNYIDAELDFMHFLHTESKIASLEVSTDYGTTWNEIYSNTQVEFEDWENIKLSLKDYIGQTIKIRFKYSKGGYWSGSGWYIDDLKILVTKDTDLMMANNQTTTGSSINLETTTGSSINLEIPVTDNDVNEEAEETNDININRDLNIDVNTFDVRKQIFNLEEENDSNKIPVHAVITVVETGRTALANPFDGYYKLNHIAEESELTIRVSRFGYETYEFTKFFGKDMKYVQDIVLTKKPRTNFSGYVYDSESMEPLKDVRIRFIGIVDINPVYTDENGYYEFKDIPEGNYNIEISSYTNKGYTTEITMDGENDLNKDILLDRYTGITYDDGTAEAFVGCWYGSDEGFAVKFSSESTGKVDGIRFYVYPQTPLSQGNRTKVFLIEAEYDEYYSTYSFGRTLAVSNIVEVKDGSWNYADFKGGSVELVPNKEYFAFVNLYDYIPYGIFIGTDKNTVDSGNNFYHVMGTMGYHLFHSQDTVESDFIGNFMIRPVISFDTPAPAINSLSTGYVTSESEIEIKGTSGVEGTVKAEVNGYESNNTVQEDNEFTATVHLSEGTNKIKIYTETSNGNSAATNLLVYKDSISPIIEWSSELPETYKWPTVQFIGSVIEKNLSKLYINDQEIDFERSGIYENYNDYDTRMELTEGDNKFVVKAVDEAGNTVIEEHNIYYSGDEKAPVVAAPINNTYTNETSIEVYGAVSNNDNVKISVNGTLAGEVTPVDGLFSKVVDLEEGNNEIIVTRVRQSGDEISAEPVNVICDTINPVINITSPTEEIDNTQEYVVVSGNVVEENFHKLTVNNRIIEVNEDKTFSTKVAVANLDTIEVVAVDKADNETTQVINLRGEPSRYPLEIKDLYTFDANGFKNVGVKIANDQRAHYEDGLTAIIQILDEDGYVVALNTLSANEILSGRNITLSTNLNLQPGKYTIEAYVWKGLDDMKSLTKFMTIDYTQE